jgi:hypothetical protein
MGLKGSVDDEGGDGVEGLQGGGIGEITQGFNGGVDALGGFFAGVGEGGGGVNEVADFVNAVGFSAFQKRVEQFTALAGGGIEEVDDGKGEFAFFDVDAEGFSDGGGVADDVEDVVLDLERDAEAMAEIKELAGDFRVGASVEGAELTGDGDQRGGFAGDDVEIGVFVEIEVVAIVNLEQFALADAVGCIGDDLADVGVIDGGAEAGAVGEKKIAQQDGGFVALEMVEGGAFSAHLGLVENVVMNERGDVDHLDDRAQGVMDVAWVSGGAGAQEQEGWAELFSGKAFDMGDQRVDTGQIAGELPFESSIHFQKIIFDEVGDSGQRHDA